MWRTIRWTDTLIFLNQMVGSNCFASWHSFVGSWREKFIYRFAGQLCIESIKIFFCFQMSFNTSAAYICNTEHCATFFTFHFIFVFCFFKNEYLFRLRSSTKSTLSAFWHFLAEFSWWNIELHQIDDKLEVNNHSNYNYSNAPVPLRRKWHSCLLGGIVCINTKQNEDDLLERTLINKLSDKEGNNVDYFTCSSYLLFQNKTQVFNCVQSLGYNSLFHTTTWYLMLHFVLECL